MRSQLGPVRSKIPDVYFSIADIENRLLGKAVPVVASVLGTHFGQFSVQMDDPGASGPLMEIVHILGHDSHIILFFKFRDGDMRRIRFYGAEFASPGIVEIEHEARISVPAFYGSHIFDLVVFPEPVAVPKRADSALGAHSGSRQHH